MRGRRLVNLLRPRAMIFALLLWVSPAAAEDRAAAAPPQVASGALEVVDVPAPSLAGSLIQMPPAERTVVYLPPSYGADAERRYPVVYYLTGFMDQVFLYTHVPYYQGFQLQEAMDRLIGEGKVAEMIVVIPNGLTPLGGSFYVNSPVNGNWEDFIVRDLVGHIDATFRTIAAPQARAISGHSMGGSGALHLGMRHPDVFAGVYALSPGLAAPGGLETHPGFANVTVRGRVCDLLDAVGGMDRCDGEVRLLDQASYWNQILSSYPLFALAYCAAFAGEPGGDGPGFQYPYRRQGEEFVLDPMIWERCEAGFGGWEGKIRENLDNLRRLSYIAIDVGENDEYPWIPSGCHHVSRLLSDAGVAHELLAHEGGHEDRLRERLETSMLPALTRFFAIRE